MFKKLLAYASLLLLSLYSQAAMAMQELDFMQGSKIRARIARKELNRIEFGKTGTLEVIGDDSKYKLLADKKASTVFLMPNLPAGEVLELAVINNFGQIADLALSIEDIEGQTIRIITDKVTGIIPKDDQEAALMLRNMIADRRGKYYVVDVKRKIESLKARGAQGIKIEQDKVYQFGNLIGARLKVTNLSSKKAVELKESDFEGLFDLSFATSIDSKVLLPKKTGFVWIVSKGDSL